VTAGRVGVALLALSATAAVGFAGVGLERLGQTRSVEQELLYLPNGRYLKVASLGHAPLVADLLYLWAIQYYSNYERIDRYRYVEHVFGDVITELDPHYVDPYWLGALIMSVEAGDLEAGLRLLDKGRRNNPDEWTLPYLAGWECYHAEQFERAAEYFGIAAQVPGAPSALSRLRAGMFTKAGDLRTAIEMWQGVLEAPGSDEASLAIAGRQIRELSVRLDLEILRQAIDRFLNDNGVYPRSLDDLVAARYIRSRPLDPEGREYDYDPTTGRVSSPAGRVLGESG
jgi:tetratricopeptide (TPR) repeat protein